MKFENNIFVITRQLIGEEKSAFDIRLIAESEIFAAHFPGNPVMPGVVAIGIIGELLEKMTGRKMALSSADNVKFLTILTPDKAPTVIIKATPTPEGALKVKATMSDADTNYVKLSLTYLPQ